MAAMSAHDAVRDCLVRRGIGLEVFTVSWMTAEAAVAVAAGIAAGSVALMAFGIDSVIEFVAGCRRFEPSRPVALVGASNGRCG